MLRPLSRLMSLLSLLAWSASAFAAEAPPATSKALSGTSEEVLDYDPERDPPAGAPSDLALWRAGRQAGFDVLASRREASRLQRHIRSQRLIERLNEASKAERTKGDAKLASLQSRLKAEWTENYAIMARRWPVEPTRGCGYPWLSFDSALRAAAAGSTRADVVTARNELSVCVARAGTAVRAMQQSNATLALSVKEAETALTVVTLPHPATSDSEIPAGRAAPGAP